MLPPVSFIGFFAFVSEVLAWQLRSRFQLLVLRILASLLWAFYYLLLGATTGAANALFGLLRNYVYAERTRHTWANKPFWPFLFLVIFLLIAVLTWEGWHSLLSTSGMIVCTFGFWQKSAQKIRLAGVTDSFLMIFYNLIVGAGFGLLASSVNLISSGIGFFRFRKK